MIKYIKMIFLILFTPMIRRSMITHETSPVKTLNILNPQKYDMPEGKKRNNAKFKRKTILISSCQCNHIY